MIYTIENDYIKACISDLGATLTKFIDKKNNTDIVLGFETEDEYIKHNGCNIGASVGRNCNRIENASFYLNGNYYKLSANENKNQLHGGGFNGFAFKRFELVNINDNSITLRYFSRDLEEGFPGNLTLDITYKLDKNSLVWSYSTISDKDTIINMTNHSYFNLGDENILNHYLCLHTNKYCPTNNESITLDSVLDVCNSPYDFTCFRKISDNLDNLKTGIDNNYVWENFNDKLLVEYKNDKYQLNVYSDLPDMHLYTAYYLNGEVGKYNNIYHAYSGICFEAQYYPNGINYDKYLKPILLKGDRVEHYIKYELVNL